MLECNNCGQAYHNECANIPTSFVKLIDVFYCTVCEIVYGLITHWKGKELSRDELKNKCRDYYDVKDIIGHRIRKNKREFMIHWENYSINRSSWEVEEHLDGCVDLLQNYCRTKRLKYTKIKSKFGEPSSSSDERHWVTMDDNCDMGKNTPVEHIYPSCTICKEQVKSNKLNAMMIHNQRKHGMLAEKDVSQEDQLNNDT